MSTYYGNAKAPDYMMVKQLRDLKEGESAYFSPNGIIVMRDTQEMFVDMEYETDRHIDWDKNEMPGPVAQATILSESRVQVDIHGECYFRGVETFPVEDSSDFRAVHIFRHFLPEVTEHAPKRKRFLR